MKLPDGYVQGSNNLVCKLNKNLYGLKQGANEWNEKLHDILSKNNYKRSENDMCLYSKQDGDNRVSRAKPMVLGTIAPMIFQYDFSRSTRAYILVHVDDIIVAATDISMITKFEKQMNDVVELKNLDNLRYYLGLYKFERTFLLH